MSTHLMHRLHLTDLVALVVLCVGGLNWLSVGLFNWNFVQKTVGLIDPLVSSLVYILVGFTAIYCAFRLPAMAYFRMEPTERREHTTA